MLAINKALPITATVSVWKHCAVNKFVKVFWIVCLWSPMVNSSLIFFLHQREVSEWSTRIQSSTQFRKDRVKNVISVVCWYLYFKVNMDFVFWCYVFRVCIYIYHGRKCVIKMSPQLSIAYARLWFNQLRWSFSTVFSKARLDLLVINLLNWFSVHDKKNTHQ